MFSPFTGTRKLAAFLPILALLPLPISAEIEPETTGNFPVFGETNKPFDFTWWNSRNHKNEITLTIDKGQRTSRQIPHTSPQTIKFVSLKYGSEHPTKLKNYTDHQKFTVQGFLVSLTKNQDQATLTLHSENAKEGAYCATFIEKPLDSVQPSDYVYLIIHVNPPRRKPL